MGLNPEVERSHADVDANPSGPEFDIFPVVYYFVMKCKEYQHYKEESMNIMVKILNRDELTEFMRNVTLKNA